MKPFRKWFIAAFLVIILFPICYPTLAYLYASHLESRWRTTHPETRLELEKYLHLYSTRYISPKESLWGKNYRLNDGERMVQYLILWNAPLDVVYDRNDRIQVIYTSYE